MGVYSINPIAGFETELGKLTDSRAVRKWLAYTTHRQTQDAEVFQAGWGTSPRILPIPFVDALPESPILLCRRLQSKQVEKSPQHRIITATYSSEPLTQEERDRELPPHQRRAKIRWNTTRNMEALAKDNNGDALVNSAGDPFDPAIEWPRSRWVLNVSKNVLDVPDYILGYEDGINRDPWTVTLASGRLISFPPRTGMLISIDIGDVQYETVNDREWEYYVFSYQVEHNRKEWVARPLDQGLRTSHPNLGIEHIMDNSTPIPRPVSSPVLLDGEGGRLANPSPETAKFLEYHVGNEVDFGVLPSR